MAGLAGNGETVRTRSGLSRRTYAHRIGHRWVAVAGAGRSGHIFAAAAHRAIRVAGGCLFFARVYAYAQLVVAPAVCWQGDRRLRARTRRTATGQACRVADAVERHDDQRDFHGTAACGAAIAGNDSHRGQRDHCAAAEGAAAIGKAGLNAGTHASGCAE